MAHLARAKIGRLLLCFGLTAALLAACDDTDRGPGAAGDPQPSPTANDSRIIGFVGTLSGLGAWRGEDAFEGADVSIGDLNRKLDGEEVPFELVSLDDEGDPDRAVELVERLAESPRTVGIVFGGPPDALPRTEEALAEAGIPAVLCYGDLYGARQLSAHVFQMSPSYLWQGRTLARYIGADREYQTVGLMAEDSADGRTATESLKQELRSAGIRLRRTVAYNPEAQQFRGDLRALREAQVEALVVHGGPSVVATILADLRSMGIRYTGTNDARVASAPRRQRRRRSNSRYWRPQVMAFDLAISDETDQSIPVGMVATDTYARGVHYLPIPSFERFKTSFDDWWGVLPTGWELRAYDSIQALGWATKHASEGDDLADVLETLDGKRFGGLPVRFGADDHTAVDAATVGLWTLPPITPDAPDTPSLEWVPLARGFSINGQRTTVLPQDWRYLFRNPPPITAPPPRISTMDFGVTSSRRDPIR